MSHALAQRITDYLAGGGLFNPELAKHYAVRDLLIECRDALALDTTEPLKRNYHFCAFHTEAPGVAHYFDGTIQTDKDPLILADYDAIKESIGAAMNPPVSGLNFTLLSFTPLPAQFSNPQPANKA